MKIHLSKQLPFVLLLGSALAFTACQKEEVQESVDVESAEANAIADLEMSNVDGFVEDMVNTEPQLNGRVAAPESLPSCATRSYNTDTHTMTIDFGTTNCLCNDGKTRRGKIVSVFEAKPSVAGARVTTTLVDYYVNDMRHTGTRIVTYTSRHNKTVVVRDASVVTPGGTISWAAERTIERVAGRDTPQLSDDVFLFSGRATGVNRRGVAYTTVTEQPLKRVMAAGCARHFVSGIIVIKNENGNTLKLNYDPTGGEPCDDIAEVTINGKRTKTIQLH
ncbi:hypothetical protein ACSX1A_17995 [Pontibacter sp. MBLB2868]|uniref:hypothetical protein n=1 Tax=Pontibacter sp. MBLB2868 TaxID=3451555 RepID=UPI003F74CACE